MKQNFSYEEIGKLNATLGTNLMVCVSVNRAGNINVVDLDTRKSEKWTLYKRGEYYLWRRINLTTGYCYPLNMKGRKVIGYNKYTGYPILDWNMENAYFKTLDEAIEYFIPYFKSHKKNYKNN